MYVTVDERGELVEWDDFEEPSYDPDWRDRKVVSYDDRQPPEYRGQTWAQAWRGEVIRSPFPPMRDGPQEPINDAFIDFQRYAGDRTRRLHPEWFCETHHTWLSVNNKCGRCLAAAEPEQAAIDKKSGKRASVYADV